MPSLGCTSRTGAGFGVLLGLLTREILGGKRLHLSNLRDAESCAGIPLAGTDCEVGLLAQAFRKIQGLYLGVLNNPTNFRRARLFSENGRAQPIVNGIAENALRAVA
jgi:hypothetical protein